MKKRTTIPEKYFSRWVYIPLKAHYSAFSITLRETIDKVKTKKLRDKFEDSLRQGGNRLLTDKEKEKRTQKKITKLEWCIANPPKYEFQEGDIFFNHDRSCWIQINHCAKLLEIQSFQNGLITAYNLNGPELVDWLKSGLIPHNKEISVGQVRSEIHRLQILNQQSKNL